MAARVSTSMLCTLLSCIAILSIASISSVKGEEHVVTLDHSNFSEIVQKHDFIVVEFYAPWCGHCKSLAPEYEKAAAILSSNDPAIILAKVDASDEANKELAIQFEVSGFPSIKILRNGGKDSDDYNGHREANGIVGYVKRQLGPASAEIKSVEDAANLIDEKTVFIVGIFSEFSGEEYENFTILAEKMRSEYYFGHTLDAKLLPRGETSVSKPTIRILKPFDELLVDFQEFEVDAVMKFIEESSIPSVAIFDNEPNNVPYLTKFFSNSNTKAMLFLNFSSDLLDVFKSNFHEYAALYKGKGISFLLGDIDAAQSAFQYYGLKEDQAPLIIIQKNNDDKYLKTNLQPEDVAPWLKDYMDGKIQPFKKSEPIPELNDEPVKVVVADSLEDMVLNSGKNVFLEFYAPWCGHCKKLAPILDEVAVSFENDADVMIAKLDATANDISKETFEVKGYPTLFFISANGNKKTYDRKRTKEDIIAFIQENRETASQHDSIKDEL